MANKITCLDHGFVQLIDHMGNDLSVVRAARVSYDAAWRAGENEGSDARLINYLWRNKHTTPFEAVTFTFEVKAPIFVFRQWHRHRTQSYNELSARYKELPEEYYIPELNKIGKQSKNNKQGREIETYSEAEAKQIQTIMLLSNKQAYSNYLNLLDRDVSRELARTVLPVAMYSHMFATLNLLNFFRFLTLRCDAHAQYEIRIYADAMRDLAKQVVPVCINAWETM